MTDDAKFIKSFGLTKEEVVFLSHTGLKKRLLESNLTMKEAQRVKRIRKRDRSKAICEKENQEMAAKISSLVIEKHQLICEQTQLEKEIEMYKIKMFLNTPNNCGANQL